MNCFTDIVPDLLSQQYYFHGVLSYKPEVSVFFAVHRETKQPVAVKIWGKPYIDSPVCVHNFLKEISILKTNVHDFVVKLIDHGQTQDCMYMITEYVSDLSLRQYILSQPISLPKAIHLIEQIVFAINSLHQSGIIHRDLKPENLLLTSQQQIILIDFGAAISETTKDEDLKEVFLGTPPYISPEVRLGEACSYASDQYAVGIIAYELLIGNLSRGKVILSLLPEQISKLLAKVLAPSPKDRYPSMQAWLHDLRAYRVSGGMANDLKEKDISLYRYEKILQAQDLLMPRDLPPSSFVSPQIHGYETGVPCVYYDTFTGPYVCDDKDSQIYGHKNKIKNLNSQEYLNHQECVKMLCEKQKQGPCISSSDSDKELKKEQPETYTFWLWSSLHDYINPLLLSMIKGIVHQCYSLQFSIHQTLHAIHKYLIEMKVPIPQQGISVLCLYMCEEEQHFLCFTCGKTCFQLKKQNTRVDIFQMHSQGLGATMEALQIQETKVAWGIGDEVILSAAYSDGIIPSFASSAFMELKDRTQKAIFGPRRDVWCKKQVSEDGSSCLSTCISLKRVR